MSEVTEAHGLSDDISGSGLHAGGAGEEDYSGYLCGACEEPLPLGAPACLVCGTPVAPLEDDEMTAGPYVFTGPGTGDGPAIVVDDPYGNEAEIGGRLADDHGDGAVTGGLLDHSVAPPQPLDTRVPADRSPEPAGEWTAPLADLAAPPASRPRDPATVIGVDRPPYERGAVGDPGPDPMLGRGPTEPVLSPPPPRIVPAVDNGRDRPAPAGLTGGQAPLRDLAPERSGPVMPLVLGAVVAVLALVAVGAFVVSRGGDGSESVSANPPPTAGPASTVSPAPAPQTPATPAPDPATFCLAMAQFKIDPNPDSIAAKFLKSPKQMVALVETLVANAPPDVHDKLVPLRDSTYAIAGQIEKGELRTAAQVKAAAEATQKPGAPRTDQVLATALVQHC